MTQSIGRYRVGIDFNPPGNEDVATLKAIAAHFIDECASQMEAIGPDAGAQGVERHELYHRAMRECEAAAMWAVKAATKRAQT